MHVIDRRRNPQGKSLGNRQRFIRRAREQIREAIKERLKERSVEDVLSGENVVISSDGIHEPTFSRDPSTGRHERVLPGNREFLEGDRIRKPPGGGGGGGGDQASEDGEGEDAFAFTLTREEFLDMFFEDLELPDLLKRRFKSEKSPRPHRAGFSITGSPNRLNLERTMRRSLARRIALGRPSEAALEALRREKAALEAGDIRPADGRSPQARIEEIDAFLARAKRRRASVPFIDPIDLRYRRYEYVPQHTAQAVMFCLMDVSASMDEGMKDLAKRFFLLLHLFLRRRYEHVEIVFIRHTSQAQEVDEETFFRGRETGGTVVSTAFKEMLRVVQERYAPADWNIYVAQASDGDNIASDVPVCVDMLSQKILPISQYMAYVEVGRQAAPLRLKGQSDLWAGYREIAAEYGNFAMRSVNAPRDIYPVFRGLFSRERSDA